MAGRYEDRKASTLENARKSSIEKIRLEEQKKFARQRKKEIEDLNKQELQAWNKLWEEKQKTVLFHAKLEKETAKALSKTWQEEMGKAFSDIAKKFTGTSGQNIRTVSNLMSGIGSALSNSMDKYLGAYSNYFSQIETRLLGTGRGFDDVMQTIKTGLGGTRATTSLKVLENLNKLVSQGISYNVEQRAFLETISEKIAATFDAANGTLTRLIRINQADTTAAYLGMESALTQFLNKQFSDTSYLTSNMSETVSEALLEATSQLGRDMGAEFEFVVQKWLGSLASVGFGVGTLSKIAQGVGYLGSGNIEALSADTALSNLFTTAANRAGLDYGTILTQGITPSDMNKLLSSVVMQMQSIASSSDMVTRSQYAQLFGMTISDLTAIMNLSSKDLVTISENMYTYSRLVKQTENELAQVLSRTTVKEQVENAVSNVMSAMGETITSSAVLYTTYLVTDMINKAGGISVPIPDLVGGISMIPVTQMMQMGIIGGTALANIGTILSALTGTGRLSLDNWGASETTGRGAGLAIPNITSQVLRSTSSVGYTGSSSTSDILGGSLAEQKEVQNISNPYAEEKDLYEAITGPAGTNSILNMMLDELSEIKFAMTRIGG